MTLNGSFERRIRTSLGEFKIDFWRVRCSKCGKTFAPLAKFIGLERYQTKSNELEKLVVEAASGTNYRRAVKDLERDGKLPVSFHTAHGWVMRSDCDEIKISPQTVGSAPIQIMPDGTGFKVGYKAVNKKLVIVPEEAELVRRIFRRYIEIQSPKIIAAELNAESRKTKTGKPWATAAVYRILNNHTYAGEINYKGTTVYEGEHDAIIDPDTWERTWILR